METLGQIASTKRMSEARDSPYQGMWEFSKPWSLKLVGVLFVSFQLPAKREYHFKKLLCVCVCFEGSLSPWGGNRHLDPQTAVKKVAGATILGQHPMCTSCFLAQ